MHDSGSRRWRVAGVLVSASWLVTACGVLPQNPGNESYSPGSPRGPEQAGYNGTIQDIPTSIDPRTPEAAGTPGRSLAMDPGERALLESRGTGGGGQGEDVVLEAVPGVEGRRSGSLYGGSGAEGAAPIPGEREVIDPTRDTRQRAPASQEGSGEGSQRR
ncbi:hypothetical protein JQX13_13115 [Archangium violaceum]|uniref:hypothetical protein n=1 Tax=Archangium violaceum TaxID=83451 RepID=UPI00193BC65B|nr:hypothetical protein [Archangium violaceum]QRK10922.1 hypothetical protein JQX13_13115 [Archangium violaceum]